MRSQAQHAHPVRSFVVGAPRSGTTVLQSQLASHPFVMSFPESHFFTALRPRRSLEVLGLASRGAWPRYRQFLNSLGVEPEGGPLRRLSMGGLTSAFVATLDSLALKAGCRAWIEKTPDHFDAIDLIEKYVESARFVHIIRDGRDTVASLYAVTRANPGSWGGQWTIERCIDKWNKAVSASLLHANEENHVVLHYEHLVRAPAEVTAAVWTFLGLEPIEFAESRRQRALKSIILDSEPWKKDVASAIDVRPSRFKSVLNEDQQAMVADRLLSIGDLRLPCCSFLDALSG